MFFPKNNAEDGRLERLDIATDIKDAIYVADSLPINRWMLRNLGFSVDLMAYRFVANKHLPTMPAILFSLNPV